MLSTSKHCMEQKCLLPLVRSPLPPPPAQLPAPPRISGGYSLSLLVSDLYFSKSTKITTNTETAMLSNKSCRMSGLFFQHDAINVFSSSKSINFSIIFRPTKWNFWKLHSHQNSQRQKILILSFPSI